MNNQKKCEKVVVAGAAGLLGSNLVVKLINQGFNVVAIDLDLEVLKSRLGSLGLEINTSRLELFELNIANESKVKLFFSSQIGLIGAVNACYPRNITYGAHFLDVSLKSFNENLALHLGSFFLFSQQCALYFKKNKDPFSLVNIASVYGVINPKFEIYNGTNMTVPVEYSAIKSAILHLNKYISVYMNDSDFRVNSVSPGGIYDSQPEVFLQAYKSNTLGSGMLNVNDMIDPIIFLLTKKSKYINGQNIIVDDGFHL